MTEFVKPSQVFLNQSASSVDEVLAFLAARAAEAGIATDEEAVLAALKAREAEGTTGMTGGFAIPHCKSAAVSQAAVFVVKFAEPIDWASMDGEPIRVAISLLVPDSEAGTTFLKLLSQVAMMLMQEEFRDKVVGTDDVAEIAATINAGIKL